MNLNRVIKAGLIGFVLTAPLATGVQAQSVLRVLEGAASSNISVAVNRAIVMESDRPFAELSVANPGIADIATLGERTIYVLGKAPGRTTLTILGPEGELITNVDVVVSPDLAEFKERLRDILPREPIEVRTANDGVILSGRVSSSRKLARALELAERYAPGKVTNLMMVGGTQQVQLKVRFAEMSRTVAKGLESSLNVNTTGTDGTGAVFGGGGNPENVGGGFPFTVNDTTNFALGAVLTFGDIGIDLLMEAFETKGMVRTLAEPNLVAISGETAKFVAGGEVPIQVDDGDGGTELQFKDFGIILEFTPIVIDEDIIRLTLDTEVSQIDSSGDIEAPFVITTRNASTSIEMRDGQSFAIAGLLQDNFDDLVGQVPILGNIPVLGALFRSTSFRREQSELVIIVTPHLVAPVDGDLLALPTDRFRIPTEAELFLNGKTSGSGPVSEIARQDFQGSYGYVME